MFKTNIKRDEQVFSVYSGSRKNYTVAIEIMIGTSDVQVYTYSHMVYSGGDVDMADRIVEELKKDLSDKKEEAPIYYKAKDREVYLSVLEEKATVLSYYENESGWSFPISKEELGLNWTQIHKDELPR